MVAEAVLPHSGASCKAGALPSGGKPRFLMRRGATRAENTR